MPSECTAHEPPVLDLLFSRIVKESNDIVILTTADLDRQAIIYVNPTFTRLTGYSFAEVSGRSPRFLQGPGTSRVTLDAIRRDLQSGREVQEKVLNYVKSGAPYWLDLRIFPLRDGVGTITHFAAIERDVTLDKRRLDELEHFADRDILTGIPNRRALLRIIDAEVVSAAAVSTSGPCLAHVKIDGVHRINLSHGRAAGDAILLAVADRISQNIRRLDTLGRVGGTTFAVCMPLIALDDACIAAEWLRRTVCAKPFETPSGLLRATVSIGVSEAHRLDHDLIPLLVRAAEALCRAQQGGNNRVECV